MNKQRRKTIVKLIEQLEAIKGDAEGLATEERDAFDNLPEGMQQGDNGSVMEAAADALDEACSNLDEVMSALSNAMA